MELINSKVPEQKMTEEKKSIAPTWSTREPTGEIPRELWARVWASLELSGLVTDGVASATSEFWRSNCKKFSNQELIEGAKRSTNFDDGKLTLPKFKKLCFENAAFKRYAKEELESKPLPKEEVKKRIAELKAALKI